jgi:hypothetical protein
VSSPGFEAFLARIYADAAARERFLADPRGAAELAGLAPEEVEALVKIDAESLRVAAESYAAKRAAKTRRR